MKMAEREFVRKAEAAAGRFERMLKGPAGRAKRRRRLVLSRAAAITAGIGLMAGAGQLAERERRAASIWCACLGAAALEAGLMQTFLCRGGEE